MYLFVLLLILSIIYFIFGWKHDPYGKYKRESCFIKIETTKKEKKKKTYSMKKVKGIKINLDFIFNNFPVHHTGLRLVNNYIRANTHILVKQSKFQPLLEE
jgi:ABC-type histidine transport system ATPase subunit